MNIETLMQYMSYILAGIGVLAFLVSVIVQTIKEMPALKKVQTNVVALITSLILTPVAVIVLCTYYQIVIEWYYIFASFIARLFSEYWWLGESDRDVEQKRI